MKKLTQPGVVYGNVILHWILEFPMANYGGETL